MGKNRYNQDRHSFDQLPEPKTEPSPRWIRVKAGELTLADSRETTLLIQYGPGRLPTYFFSPDTVETALLAAPKERDNRRIWDVVANDLRIPEAAWSFIDSPEGLDDLAGLMTFSWRREGITWYEEAQEVFAHARDPNKRVDAIPSVRQVRVEIAGEVVAESNRPVLLFETFLPTRYYLPRADVRMEFLTPSALHTLCPYKGQASYWSVTVGDRTLEDIVWSYPDPIPENPRIEGLLCFLNEKVDLYVDGELQEKSLTPWS